MFMQEVSRDWRPRLSDTEDSATREWFFSVCRGLILQHDSLEDRQKKVVSTLMQYKVLDSVVTRR
jgi:hypothetical protein